MRRITMLILGAVLCFSAMTGCSQSPPPAPPAGAQGNNRVGDLAKKSRGNLLNLSQAEQAELNTLTEGHAQQAISAYNRK